MNKLINRYLADVVWKRSRLLFILESAKRQEMVAFRYKYWKNLGDLAITRYKQYWEYIELAFKKFGIWEILIESNKKGKFQRKLMEFYENMPEQDYTVDELINELNE